MTKKIGVISDTHGLLRPQVLDVLKDCDCIIHAGDIGKQEILDALWPLGSLYAVRGNCDGAWAQNLCRGLTFQIDGVSFYLTHDRKNVPWNLEHTDVVIFGHSHHYTEEYRDGRLWLNPGSCGVSRFGGEVTMAVLTLEEGNIRVEKKPVC